MHLSQTEIGHVLSLGVSPSRIIYANPIKPVSMIRYVREHGVDLMTADCSGELQKIAKNFPSARSVLFHDSKFIIYAASN